MLKSKRAILIFSACLAFSMLGAAYLWWIRGLAAPQAFGKERVFVITPGETVNSIAASLYKEQLIRNPLVFKLYLKKEGVGGRLEAGDYRLFTNLTVPQLVRILQHGMLDRWFKVIEGLRVEEIAELAQRDLTIPKEQFGAFSKEGYMFPDTYLIPVQASAAAVAAIMQHTFDERVNVTMREDAARQGLTLDEVVTLASLVEREALNDVDRPVIAGILRKRLAIGMPLQVDATIQYALGYQPWENKTKWWKQNITYEDKTVASSYNTYKYTGLPPGPICNPGLASIKAIIYPKESPYLYYLHGRDGKSYFAVTNEEHEENKRKAGL